jgi:hypothetical protein
MDTLTTDNLWDDEILIEREKNLMKCDGQDNISSTLNIKNDLEKKALTDIKRKEYAKIYYQKNKEKNSLRCKEWYKNNKAARNNYVKEWYRNNKDRKLFTNRQWDKENSKTNLNFKLGNLLRRRLYKALKGNFKMGSAVKDLGCSTTELKKYIESKFTVGMTWENHSYTGWHIDHIKPLASFNLQDRVQFLEACHYTNLQPLWAKDNMQKSDNTQFKV